MAGLIGRVRGGVNRHAVILGICAVVVVLALPTLTYPLGRDQGEFATIGRGLLNGRVPYVDLWNPKPPAVFFVYAGAMLIFGQASTIGLRAIDLLMTPPLLIGLYLIAVRLYGLDRGQRIGWIAAALFGAFYFTETFWTLTQNDGIALVPMVWAVYAAIEAARSGGFARRRSVVYALLAGMLAGITFWFKYPFVVFIGALVVLYLALRRAAAMRPDPRAVVGFSAGVLLTGGGIALVMIGMGAWDDLIESARVTASYAALGVQTGGVVDWLVTALGFRWSHWGLLAVLTAFGLWRAGFVVIVWLAAGLAIMLVQAKGYDYHWLPLLPPLVLIAAGGVDRVAGWLSRQHPRIRSALTAAVVGGAVALMAVVIWPPALRDDHSFIAGEFNADESLAAAAYLRDRTTPGDSLFIWGFRPEVYYLSRLNPATRYIFQFPLVGSWYPQEWRDDNVSLLWAALPPYVAILQGDYMPWVTGSDEDSAMLLQTYEELNDWLIYNYERDAQIGTFQLWKRKTSP